MMLAVTQGQEKMKIDITNFEGEISFMTLFCKIDQIFIDIS